MYADSVERGKRLVAESFNKVDGDVFALIADPFNKDEGDVIGNKLVAEPFNKDAGDVICENDRYRNESFIIQSLESQIDTLRCINESRAVEIKLLRQALESPQQSTPNLMESFATASEAQLAQVFALLEKHLNVSDIHSVTPAIVRLVNTESQFHELVRLLDPINGDPNRAFSRASKITPEFATSNLVRKNSAVAWFHK